MKTITIDSVSPQRYIELLHVLVERNLKARYRGSFLGVYWSLLNPLIMTGLYTAIFGATFAQYYDNSTLNYVLAAFTGLVVINFYNASTSQALSSIVSNGSLLNKIKIPVSVFPISMIIANVWQFSIGTLPLLAFTTIITSHNLFNLVWLIFILISLSLVCSGVGFFVATLYVFFRDLPYFYELVCFVVWISSPVFYPAEIVPEQVRSFLVVNPLTPIIESLRQVSLSTGSPSFFILCKAMLTGFISLGLGWSFFQWQRRNFMDLI